MKPVWFDMEEILVGKANAMLVKRPNTPWGRNPMRFMRTFLEYDGAIWSIVRDPPPPFSRPPFSRLVKARPDVPVRGG